MAAPKRSLEGSSSTTKAKKSRTESHPTEQPKPTTPLVTAEVDFPRGGGTSFTPLEVKAIRAEAAKEADDELFQVRLTLVAVTALLNLNARRMQAKIKRARNENARTENCLKLPSLLKRWMPLGLNTLITRYVGVLISPITEVILIQFSASLSA